MTPKVNNLSRTRRRSEDSILLVAVLLLSAGSLGTVKGDQQLRAVLLSVDEIAVTDLEELKVAGSNAIVLSLDDHHDKDTQTAAAEAVLSAELELSYWIEVARCPSLADDHPEWMASLQGHQEWRRLFKNPPQAEGGDSVVLKNYPWVPILYQEAFDAHLSRIGLLLKDMPSVTRVFLNDLQGAPSACGCGNTLCRWTADYGPIKTATPLRDDAAARFVASVKSLVPDSDIIPVWLTECEEHDGASDGLCAGVGCFNGICWKAWTAQLKPLAAESRQIAALLPFREFQREADLYGGTAAWVSTGLKFFQTMPQRHATQPVAAKRLIAILQGWNVTEAEITAQKAHVTDAGAAGYVVARNKIDQSWQPKLYRLQQ